MSEQSIRFEQRIAAILRRQAIPFSENVGVGGVSPDFLVESTDGRLIVVEAKSWPATETHRNRAIHQVRLYREAVGIDEAIFVLEGLERGSPTEGLVTEKELPAVLALTLQPRRAVSAEPSAFSFGKPLSRAQARPRRAASSADCERTIFAAMPFSGDYDDTYFVAMGYAAEYVGAVCRRVDQENFQGDILEYIKKLIRGSVAVIADLSESKPNVLYETGFAHALSLPTIHICSTPLGELPFDVRNWSTVEYSRGQTVALRDPLAKRLAGALLESSARPPHRD